MKILMVCLGNICRSPLAEAVLQMKADKAGLDWVVESAGTNGYHSGEAPHKFSQKVAKQNGLDISCQVARHFTAEDFSRYDKIYAMASDVLSDMKAIGGARFDRSKTELFLNALDSVEDKDVPDPWYGEESGYHEVFKIISESCDSIIQKYLATQESATNA